MDITTSMLISNIRTLNIQLVDSFWGAVYTELSKPRIGKNINGKKNKPIPKKLLLPKHFASFMNKTIITTIFKMGMKRGKTHKIELPIISKSTM